MEKTVPYLDNLSAYRKERDKWFKAEKTALEDELRKVGRLAFQEGGEEWKEYFRLLSLVKIRRDMAARGDKGLIFSMPDWNFSL